MIPIVFVFLSCCVFLISSARPIEVSETFMRVGPFGVDGVTLAMTRGLYFADDGWLTIELLDGREIQLSHPMHKLDLDNLRLEYLSVSEQFKQRIYEEGIYINRCDDYHCTNEVGGASKTFRKLGWSCLTWICGSDPRPVQQLGRIFQF